MQMNVVLTVAESKRLIAKGVAKLDCVRRALEEGILAIAKGTTDSYIVEEVLGKEIAQTDYCTGVTLPTRSSLKGSTSSKIPDVVLKQGEPLDMPVVEAIKEMGEGDVFIKGANALNYERRQAGILIGHPAGGTIGATIGAIYGRRIKLLLPVGLEKNVPVDLHEAAARAAADPNRHGHVPNLWPVGGQIITEIEAIKSLTMADAIPFGAGGIGGAEGSVRLLIQGTPVQVEAAASLLETIFGEPPVLG